MVLTVDDAGREEVVGSRNVPSSSGLAQSFTQRLASGAISSGAASLNNAINEALGTGGTESNAVLERWSRAKMLGDPMDRIFGGIENDIKNLGKKIKSESIGAINQTVNAGADALTEKLLGKNSGPGIPLINYNEELIQRRDDKLNSGQKSKRGLYDFYSAFSSVNMSDRRFSMLQPYLYDVEISISKMFTQKYLTYSGGTFAFNPNNNTPSDSQSSTGTTKLTRFEQLYNYYVEANGDGKGRGFKLLVSSLDLPNIAGFNTESINTEFGYVSLPSSRVMPDDNKFTLNILNTEQSMIEGFMVEWLGETCGDRYFYHSFPFYKAEITVKFYTANRRQVLFSYIFKDCFPIAMETQNPSHKYTMNDTRSVTMAFDYMLIDNPANNSIIEGDNIDSGFVGTRANTGNFNFTGNSFAQSLNSGSIVNRVL